MTYSQTQIANFSMPSRLVEVDVGTDGNYTSDAPFVIVSTGDGGNIVVRAALDSADVTLVDTQAGASVPVLLKQITASGTTPNNIVVGFYQA